MQGRGLIAALCILSPWLVTGCTVTTQMSVAGRSGLEQQLLVRSLERAISGLDVQGFTDRPIAVEFVALTDADSQTFAEKFIRARLKEIGCRVVAQEEDAKVKLQIFALIFGANQNETLIGLPSLPTPIGFALPELALYKMTQNQGRTELEGYVFDSRTGEFIRKTPMSAGRADVSQYKILTMINFTLSDLEK